MLMKNKKTFAKSVRKFLKVKKVIFNCIQSRRRYNEIKCTLEYLGV